MIPVWAQVYDTFRLSVRSWTLWAMLVLLAVWLFFYGVLPSFAPEEIPRVVKDPASYFEEKYYWEGRPKPANFKFPWEIDPAYNPRETYRVYKLMVSFLGQKGHVEHPRPVYYRSSREAAAYYIGWAEQAAMSLGMVVFLLVTVGNLTWMFEKGTADLLFSRPISRLKLLLGRYLGSVVWVSLLVLVYVVLVLLMGLMKTGVFYFRGLVAIPLLAFAFACVYSTALFVAAVFRGRMMAILMCLTAGVVVTILGLTMPGIADTLRVRERLLERHQQRLTRLQTAIWTTAKGFYHLAPKLREMQVLNLKVLGISQSSDERDMYDNLVALGVATDFAAPLAEETGYGTYEELKAEHDRRRGELGQQLKKQLAELEARTAGLTPEQKEAAKKDLAQEKNRREEELKRWGDETRGKFFRIKAKYDQKKTVTAVRPLGLSALFALAMVVLAALALRRRDF